ncbi:MAG: DUF92 domain-containing protein [Anaerolineae bacterium]|nr:MAG: DUF92 domain-containing protein [Anaerolineae bacterium]
MVLDLVQLLGGLLLSGLIGWAAYQRGALTRNGMTGAVITGTLIFGFGGWTWGLLLIAFFVSSSGLSRYRELEKESLAEKFAKSHQRDVGQVLANGGWGAVLAVAHAFTPHPALWAAFVGAMAAVAADTWATELGVLSRGQPRLITTRQPVPVGTSGGVSVLGTVATVAGGLFIGLVMFLLHGLATLVRRHRVGWSDLWIVVVGLAGGLAGSLFDSLLGATVQGMYYCDRCAKETEKTRHGCGQATQLVRGYRWLSNDLVNLLSSFVGSVAAVVVAWFGRQGLG